MNACIWGCDGWTRTGVDKPEFLMLHVWVTRGGKCACRIWYGYGIADDNAPSLLNRTDIQYFSTYDKCLEYIEQNESRY